MATTSQSKLAIDSILRGLVAGTAGAPMDIIGLLNKAINTVAKTKLNETPSGGSADINKWLEKVGAVGKMRSPEAELIASLMPGPGEAVAAVKTAALGMVGGAKHIKALDMDELFGEVLDIYTKKKATGATEKQAQFAAGRHSEDVLKRASPQGEVRSMFISPYGEAQVVLDDSAGKLKLLDYDIGDLNQAFMEKSTMKLSDLYEHPLLYDISDKAKAATVRYNSSLGVGNAAYNPTENAIELGIMTTSKSGLQHSRRAPTNKRAAELADEMVRHELTHLLGVEANAVSRGTANDATSITKALTRQAAMIEPTADQRALYDYILGTVNAPYSSTKEYDAVMRKLYTTNYGEWIAEAGARYAPSTLPGVTMPKNLW